MHPLNAMWIIEKGKKKSCFREDRPQEGAGFKILLCSLPGSLPFLGQSCVVAGCAGQVAQGMNSSDDLADE